MTARPRTVQTGFLLLDKPAGLTSHDAVSRVRRAFGQREVGHAGTLDPAATGLLVMALGDATRLLRFVEAFDKAYEGTIRLGRTTTTYDGEGDTVAEAPVPAALDPDGLARAVVGLTGAIEQTVPQFSAVKVDGERLYAKARRGEAVEAPRRRIMVHALALTRVAPPDLDFFARVSKGTYIRSLAVDLGAALGLPAHLARLRRTRVGSFDVADAHTVEDLRGEPSELFSVDVGLAHLPVVRLDESGLRDVSHGRPLSPRAVELGAAEPFAAGDALRLVGPDGRLAAMAEARIDRAAVATATTAPLAYACVLVKPPVLAANR